MKLVVVALLCAGMAFAEEGGSEVGFKNPIVVDSGDRVNQQQQLENARLAKLAARRAQIAAAKAKAGITTKGIRFSDGGTNQTVGKIVVTSPPDEVTVPQEVPEHLSAAQLEDLAKSSKQHSLFVVPEGEKHPLSTLESVERELGENKTEQDEVDRQLSELEGKKKEGFSEQQKRHYHELDALNERLKKQQEVLINSQEFLAFCKSTSSSVTFTGPELEKIFTVLDLPSLSENSLKTVPGFVLNTALEGALKIISKVNEEGKIERKMGYVMTDDDAAITDLPPGYILRKEKGTLKIVEKQYFDAPFTEAKKNILKTYLTNKLEEISRLEEHSEKPSDTSVYPVERKLLDATEFTDRVEGIKNILTNITDLLKNYEENKTEISSRIQSVRAMISEAKNNFTTVFVDPKASKEHKQFLEEIDKEQIFVEMVSDCTKIASGKIALTLEELPEIVDILLRAGEADPEIQRFTGSSILEKLDKSDLAPEQKQFLRKIIKKTSTLADLKSQAKQAIDSDNVVRMQELQDEMRDLYEDVMRNSWKDESLIRINTDFLLSMRSSINDLLVQFGEKAKSFTSAAMNKKSFAARVKYQFKRLFVRAKIDPRKVVYISEIAENSAFHLDLVNFKKAATDGYVETVKLGIKPFTDALAKVKELPSNKVDEKGLPEQLKAIAHLRTAFDTVQPVAQELFALQGVASLKGTLSFEIVAKSLSISDVPLTAENFLRNLESVSGAGKYKRLALGLLKMVDSSDATKAISNIQNKNPLSDEQEALLKKTYTEWFEKIVSQTANHRSDLSANNLPNLRLLATFNDAPAEYVTLFRTPQTGQYVIDAYKTKSNVTVPSGQAQAIVSNLSDFVAQLKQAEQLLAKRTVEAAGESEA